MANESERYPGSWYIANIDRKELADFEDPVHLLQRLAILSFPESVDALCDTAGSVHQTSSLFWLPTELLDRVFTEILELHSKIAMAITCKHLLTVGKDHILRAAQAYYAPWAGCRLVILNDDSSTMPKPCLFSPDVLTAAERDELETWRRSEDETDGNGALDSDQSHADQNHGSTGHEDTTPSFFAFVGHTYRLVFGWVWELRRTMGAASLRDRISQEFIGSTIQVAERQDIAPYSDSTTFNVLLDSATYYPVGARILCNMSRTEYVREDAIPITLGWKDVLHSKIGVLEATGTHQHGGSWVGDRICYTTLDRLPLAGSQPAGREWRDVTGTTVSELC